MKSMGAPKFTRTAAAGKPRGHRHLSPEIWPPEILVVEDGTGVLPIIGGMLQCRGFQVILAPDVPTALQEMGHYEIAAVIAGASREEEHGLDLLEAVKKRRAQVKTLVVTHLVNPGLPVRAYEMDIDDYLHWPLSGTELSNRLRGLLGGKGEADPDVPIILEMAEDPQPPAAAVAGVLEGCTEMLCQISQAVTVISQKHAQDMSLALQEDLQRLTGLIHTLSRRLCQARPGAPTAPTPTPAGSPQFH